MQTTQSDYFSAYRSLKLTRASNGVLVAEFHTKDGPLTFTAQTEFVDAFYRIAQDRANKIVILTGAGGDFMPEIDFSSFGNVADPDVWSQVHDEGAQILTRRNTRAHFIHPLKERIVREVGYDLSLEGASAADLVKSMHAKSEPVAQKEKVA